MDTPLTPLTIRRNNYSFNNLPYEEQNYQIGKRKEEKMMKQQRWTNNDIDKSLTSSQNSLYRTKFSDKVSTSSHNRRGSALFFKKRNSLFVQPANTNLLKRQLINEPSENYKQKINGQV